MPVNHAVVCHVITLSEFPVSSRSHMSRDNFARISCMGLQWITQSSAMKEFCLGSSMESFGQSSVTCKVYTSLRVQSFRQLSVMWEICPNFLYPVSHTVTFLVRILQGILYSVIQSSFM